MEDKEKWVVVNSVNAERLRELFLQEFDVNKLGQELMNHVLPKVLELFMKEKFVHVFDIGELKTVFVEGKTLTEYYLGPDAEQSNNDE